MSPAIQATVLVNGPSAGLDIITVAERCIGCGICSEQCPGQAITLSPGALRRDKSRCDGCGNCVEICPTSVHLVPVE